ncbi:YsnF/AvaK domain-containing protein [Cognatilysobacter bugurensis]|uniref:DUF2382 domain-containing protein n=1 Tax=Cognatilysobacter bugurensis TaxID=543356 RepID=A0A918SXQ5_9GAMM|nr:YsnF/AvaK domain-containing protein [Lysobacter bugurensis]GHA76915.1 hypothetical protein GCM10007067_12760 [Lysobacter bugurensis]
MAVNLIGIFDDRAVAEDAVQQIRKLGIEQERIRAHHHGSGLDASSSGRSDEHHGFFSKLFGGGDHDNDAHELSGHYAEAVRRGSSVVTVHLEHEDKAAEVERILENAGSVDLDERVHAWRSSGYDGYKAGARDFTADEIAKDRETLKVVQEELRVGKRQVQAGGVRVRRHIVETPVSEQITLRDEQAVIERRPVDRLATAADLQGFDAGDKTIEVRETHEEAVIDKQARVVEEISIGKKAVEHTETINDTIRRTDVDVEHLDASNAERMRSKPGDGPRPGVR